LATTSEIPLFSPQTIHCPSHEYHQAPEVRETYHNTAPPFPILNLTRSRKYPQFQQGDIFGFQDAFRKLDADDKGYLDEASTIRAVQQSEHQPYDVVRQALREVELDSSKRVELEDYVDVGYVRP
jgi:hypothetical protein